MLKLSDAIEHEDLQTLKFYVKSISKKKKVWDAKNTMELFVSLEQAGHIKHEDPEPLIEMMTRIGRNDLIGLINNHFGKI